jgi:beta-galactosidase
MCLDRAWRFARSDVPGAAALDFDDSGWETVGLPHTWNSHDGQDGGNDHYRGVGWYRGWCPVPADCAGRVLFLKFDGASLVTGLHVNGTFVGEHRGGFAAFVWDVTQFLEVGRDNLLAVKVDNAFHPDVPPLECDFTVGGSLYRRVWLVATDPLHVSLTDFASPGVCLKPTNVSTEAADVQVTARLRNDGSSPPGGDRPDRAPRPRRRGRRRVRDRGDARPGRRPRRRPDHHPDPSTPLGWAGRPAPVARARAGDRRRFGHDT